MMNRFFRLLTGALVVTTGLWHTNIEALEISWTGQPDSFPLNMRRAQVTGFAGLNFGMGIEQVEQFVRDTWPAANIERQHDPVQRVTMLVFNIDDLAPVADVPEFSAVPAPAPATVTCVFGYQSQRLATVNVDWYAGRSASEAQREALLTAGSAYTAHMLGDVWPMAHSSRGHVLDDGVLLMFAGRDIEGHGVEVRVHGIAMEILNPDGTVVQRPAPPGQAHLHIGVSAQPDEPDVFRLPDNSF